MWNELVLKQTGKDVITDSWPQLRSSEWLQKSCNKPKILMLFPLARWRYSKLQCLYYFPWLPRDASVDYSEDCTVNTVKLWTFNWSLMTGILSSLWGVSQRWKLWVVLALTHNCVTVVHVMVVMYKRNLVFEQCKGVLSGCRLERSVFVEMKIQQLLHWNTGSRKHYVHSHLELASYCSLLLRCHEIWFKFNWRIISEI